MKRLLPIFILIVLLIGCAIAPFVLFRPDRYRQPLIDQLSKVFRHPVLIGKIEARYFPPQLVLEQLSILKTSEVRYVTVNQAALTLGWGALVGQVTPPTQIQLSGAQVTIQRLASGAWDYTDWWPTNSNGGEKTGHPDVVIKNSTLVWADDFAPAHAEIQMKSLEGQWSSASSALTLTGELGGAALPASFNFQAKGPLGMGDWSGTAKFTDSGRTTDVTLRRQGGLWQVTGHSAEWRLDSAAALARFFLRLRYAPSGAGSSFLRDWKTDFTALGDTATFTHSAAVDGGNTELKGTMEGQAPARIALTAALQNVPVASLKPLFGSISDGVDGKLTGVVSRFELPVSSGAWENAHADFVFELTEGSYRLPNATLQTLKKVKTANYMRKKFPEFEDKGFPFSKLRLQGMLDHGGITLQQAGLVSGDIRAAAVGRLEGAPRSLDLWLELQIHEALPHLRKELPERYVVGEAGRERVQPIFGHLQGLWSEWHLRAAPHSKVPGAAQKKLHSGLTV